MLVFLEYGAVYIDYRALLTEYRLSFNSYLILAEEAAAHGVDGSATEYEALFMK